MLKITINQSVSIILENHEEELDWIWTCYGLYKGETVCGNVSLHRDLSSYFLPCDRSALDGTDETQYSSQMWETVMSHMRGSHQFSDNWKVWQHWRKHRLHLLLADTVMWLSVHVNCRASEILNFTLDLKMHGCVEYEMVNTFNRCAPSMKEGYQLFFKVCVGGGAQQLVIYIIWL